MASNGGFGGFIVSVAIFGMMFYAADKFVRSRAVKAVREDELTKKVDELTRRINELEYEKRFKTINID